MKFVTIAQSVCYCSLFAVKFVSLYNVNHVIVWCQSFRWEDSCWILDHFMCNRLPLKNLFCCICFSFTFHTAITMWTTKSPAASRFCMFIPVVLVQWILRTFPLAQIKYYKVLKIKYSYHIKHMNGLRFK